MPRNVGFRLVRELHVSLLFAVLTPQGGPLKIGRRELRGLIKPAGKNGSPAKAARFFGQNDEDGLRHLLGFVWVAEPAQCRRVNQVHVPPDQRGKRRLGTVRGKFPHQIHVVGVHFCPIMSAGAAKADILFPGSTWEVFRNEHFNHRDLGRRYDYMPPSKYQRLAGLSHRMANCHFLIVPSFSRIS